MMRSLFIFSIAVTFLVSCDRKKQNVGEPTPSERAEPASGESDTAGTPAAAADESGWAPVNPGDLTGSQEAQLKAAIAAQTDLGKTLVDALSKSVSERGFADSIEFCRGAAPDVTEKVAGEHGVKIGRTSHRLRNPNNAPPEWATPTVEKKTGPRQLFEGPDGRLGVLTPIQTAELCVNCHGPEEKLADGVAGALATDYPRDRATGFSAGDLRGWFWVEVPSG